MLKNCIKNKSGFTLLELLVVVVIISILTAIALPQYKRIVWKAHLHKGISLVESLYQAQQAYYLVHGSFSKNIDDLDLSVPVNESCTKTQGTWESKYKCSFGTVGVFDKGSNIQYQAKGSMAYLHVLKDNTVQNYNFKAGKRYCFAWPTRPIALEVCQNMGGVEVSHPDGSWVKYELP